ncbi:hypothetical protein POM88_022775 [Heracleum sosnowskyi]|uniref:Uncharacterized protein n=1 Tax=Heracleum sosnowskyi TaxID=360622 RepID=A0AAD8IFY5_9APIA|nr:hypothetical protein POM88_022775 [Heracleum sosnowskyi]
MDGGKACSHIQQADQVKTTEGMSREERLDLYIASFKVRSIFHWDDNADLSGPHRMTMREFASMQLDDIEHGNFDLEVDYSNIIDCSAVLRFYDPTENIMASETELTELMECSSQAIGEYNNTNGTHFQVVRVLKANVEVLSPYGSEDNNFCYRNAGPQWIVPELIAKVIAFDVCYKIGLISGWLLKW